MNKSMKREPEDEKRDFTAGLPRHARNFVRFTDTGGGGKTSKSRKRDESRTQLHSLRVHFYEIKLYTVNMKLWKRKFLIEQQKFIFLDFSFHKK